MQLRSWFLLTALIYVSHTSFAAETAVSTTAIIDGSSTVYPLTVAIAERYAGKNQAATFEVLCSGSTTGLRRLTTGEVMIAGASRPIKSDELAVAAKAGIEIIELPVAIDGLSVVMNKHNSFVDYLTIAELKRIWEPESTVQNWHQVRPSFPDLPIELFGAGKNSGTFDYFTEVVVGKARSSRSDYTGSEDDNDLVRGVVKNKGGLGYFGMAYLHENETLLKAVAIDAGSGPVYPTTETVASGEYHPLSRPLFIYVNKAALERTEIRLFIEYYLEMAPTMSNQVGYVPFLEKTYELIKQRLNNRTVGSMYQHAAAGAKLHDLLMAQVNMSENKSNLAMTKQVPQSTATTSASTAASSIASVVTKAVPTVSPVAPGLATKTPELATTKAIIPPALPKSAQVLPGKIQSDPSLANLDAQQVDYLRERSIAFARLTLDEATTVGDLSARIEELKLLATSLSKLSNDSDKMVASDQASFTDLISRLQLTSDGRSILNDSEFIRFKESMMAIQDPSLRRDFSQSLLRPGPEQLPLFTAALSRANGGQTDIDTILCYARGGFTVH
jgi:phosphate transport system substrate-binding protein